MSITWGKSSRLANAVHSCRIETGSRGHRTLPPSIEAGCGTGLAWPIRNCRALSLKVWILGSLHRRWRVVNILLQSATTALQVPFCVLSCRVDTDSRAHLALSPSSEARSWLKMAHLQPQSSPPCSALARVRSDELDQTRNSAPSRVNTWNLGRAWRLAVASTAAAARWRCGTAPEVVRDELDMAAACAQAFSAHESAIRRA